jgi:hypothetical protein
MEIQHVSMSFDLQKLLACFFGLAACSWVPHWACHYYRLETGSTFVVGKWNFSAAESVISLIVYGLLIAINLAAISFAEYRVLSATISGIGHLSIGLLHGYRLTRPFNFEIFGHQWPRGASLREVIIVIPFGLLCLFVAAITRV